MIIYLYISIKRRFFIGRVDYKDGSWYEGDVKNGLPNGYGTLQYANGEKYEGEMRNNEFYGYGTFWYKDKTWYKGQFKDGQITGKVHKQYK